jgi:hypothetical protein
MKAFRLLLVIVLLLPLRALRADSEERPLMSVDIPFAFTVANTRLPAGHYVIYSVDFDHLWRLSSFRRGGTAFFSITTDQVEPKPGLSKLVFYRYEKEYVLHAIDENPRSTKATLLPTKREKQLERSSSQPEIAMVYAQSGAQAGTQRQ